MDGMRKIFAKRGVDWTEAERAACIAWLLLQEQQRKILQFVSSRYGSHLYEPRDVCSSFYLKIAEEVIRKYDPDRGVEFWNHLLYCLSNHCREVIRRSRRRVSRETSLTEDEEKGRVELVVDDDQLINPEETYRLKELLEKSINELHRQQPDLAEALIAVELRHRSLSSVAADLGLRPGTLRVKLHRARRKLREIADKLNRVERQ